MAGADKEKPQRAPVRIAGSLRTDDRIVSSGVVSEDNGVAPSLGGAERLQVVTKRAQLGTHVDDRLTAAMLAIVNPRVEPVHAGFGVPPVSGRLGL